MLSNSWKLAGNSHTKRKWTSKLSEKKWKTKGGKGWKGDTEKEGHVVAGRLVRRAKIKMVQSLIMLQTKLRSNR